MDGPIWNAYRLVFWLAVTGLTVYGLVRLQLPEPADVLAFSGLVGGAILVGDRRR